MRDLKQIVVQLTDNGVDVEFLSERLLFSGSNSDPFQTLQLHLIGAFSEFERTIIRKRQAERIAKAKARDVYKNMKRVRKVSDKRLLDLVKEGFNKTEIAETLGISRMTVHRRLTEVASLVA